MTEEEMKQLREKIMVALRGADFHVEPSSQDGEAHIILANYDVDDFTLTIDLM